MTRPFSDKYHYELNSGIDFSVIKKKTDWVQIFANKNHPQFPCICDSSHRSVQTLM